MVIGAYDPIIAEASRRFGVPEERIRAVMQVESGGQPWARSPKGAGGLMQIMPGTYTDLAKRHGLGPDRFDPRNNIMGGTAYLGEMYDQFGDWDGATLAYNMGPGRAMKVRNGTASLPAETAAYGPRVQAALTNIHGQAGPQTQEANVPLFSGPRVGSLTGLLEIDENKNYADGLGNLLNFGQTPSQPPRTDPAAPAGSIPALPGTTQTDRLGLGSRINTLLEQYLKQPPKAMPSELQYMLAGAQRGMAGLTGVHDRPVGIGEMLGALGGGVTSGGLAYDEAAQQRQGSELDRLLKAGAYQNQQRTADLNEQNSVYDNQYKRAMAIKALTPERDAKVVGKGVYVDGKWIQAPWANGSDGSGPLEGTGYDAQMTNVYVTLSQKAASGQPLTAQETQMMQLAERHLMKPRLVTGPDGVVREVAPAPLPTIGGGTGGPAPSPTPDPSATTAPNATPTPTQQPPSRVTEVVPATVKPTNEQNLNAGFANRLNMANTVFDTLEAKGYQVPTQYDLRMSEIPGVGNYMVSSEFQQMDQGQREFINAQLRRESGAAISPSEFDNARKQYFPQPGDSPERLAQKRLSRELAIRNMAQSAGPAKLEFTPKAVKDDGGASKLSDDELKKKLGL